MSPLTDVEKLVIEGRYGRADLALRRLEALIPSLAATADTNTLLLALYGRALLLRQEGATTQNALAACDVLERAAHEREAVLWVATACATRARFRVDSGDIGGATADLARADAEAATGDLTSDTGYRLLDALALVYAGLRLHDRADEVRGRIEHSIGQRRVLDQGQHWSTWAGELAARAMEPLAGGAPDPEHELMGRAIEIAAKLDALPEAEVPSTLRRGARGVRALSAAYRGRPSEALRLLGPDAFGTVGDLPLVERQIVSLAAMRAHALVGSLATARSLDDAATTPPATLPNLILEVCRTRERLWLETYAGGDVIPVLHRMTELLVRLGWRGMDLVADTARQALEHQALRTESRTDALTGVGNRRALDEELRQLLRFGPLPLALILVDIDHFKGVNDVYTHVVGDEVLKRVAASLSMQLRTDDQLLRYGGDEFVVLLPGTGDEEADAVAGRMRAAVAERPWSELADGLQVSITTGVAAVWSLSGRRPDADAEKLFRRADERLLEGKRSRPEVSRSHTRPPLPAASVQPAAPEQPATPSAEITVMVGTEIDGFDRTGVTDVRIANAGLVNAVAPGTDDSLSTANRPVARDLIGTGYRPAADPTSAETDSDDELDDDEPDLGHAFPGSTPARSRITSHAAMPAPTSPERQSRSVFGPDPDVDLETETPIGLASRPSGRRDARPRPIEAAEAPRRNPATQAPPMRSRREARAAGKPETDSLHETSASRDAAEAEAAAREVAKAQADDARKRAAREARARADAAHEAEVRARAEAEKAARAAEARDRQAREQAARETAAREQAARETAAREAAAREQAAREQAERETAAREQAAREQAEREAAERERAAQEKAAREAAAREKLLREAAERERAAQQAAAREAAEAEARAKAAREQAAREQAEREQAERERAAREAAETAAREAAEAAAREAEARAEQERRRAAERARVERERREAEAREQEVREAKARAEQARRAAEAREKERRDAEIREQAAREKAAREQAEKEKAAREAAEAAAARAAAEAREAAEAERRRAAERARVEAERRRAEQERRAAEAREKQRREEEAKAEQERREAKAEQARLEAAARARAERELVERQRVEQERQTRERREREQREAEARVAEQRRQEARARAEAEARTAAIERARIRAEAEAERARAADQIREEAYARAAEQARRAATGSFPMPSQAPGQAPGQPSRGPNYEPASNGSVPLAPAAGTGQPLQRRTPLYDASQPTDTGAPEQFRERRSHPRPSSQPQPDPIRSNPGPQPSEGPYRNGQNGFGQNGFGQKQNPNGQNGSEQPEEADQDGLDTTIIRTRRQPFGPVTRSQAIIDLSARKRPRSPYSS